MLFSIIIPVYNKEKYIDKCITSVLEQTERDFEILLLDDGSTDKSAEICDKYALKYSFIRVIHKKNEGLMMTRRRGFMGAEGQFFLCVDSDDFLLKNTVLSLLRKLFDEYNCEIIQFEWENRTPDGDIIKKDSVFSYELKLFNSKNISEIRQKLCLSKMNNIWSRAYSKRVIDIEVDYSPWKSAICRGEDIFQSFAPFDKAASVLYYGESLYCYSCNADSISYNPRIEFFDAYRAIYTRKDQYLDKWQIEDSIKNSIHSSQIHHLAKLLVALWEKSEKKEQKCKWKQYIRGLRNDSFTKERYVMSKELNSQKFDRIILCLASYGLPYTIIAISKIRLIKNKILGRKNKVVEYY